MVAHSPSLGGVCRVCRPRVDQPEELGRDPVEEVDCE
jgi:hypothetical protein